MTTLILQILLLVSVVLAWMPSSPTTVTNKRIGLFQLLDINVEGKTANSNPIENKKALNSVIDEALSQEDDRNVPSLQDWALEEGVQLASGVELLDNGLGDWGVGLNQSQVEGTAVMTIPADIILSSEDPQVQKYRDSVTASMKKDNKNMEMYVPEFLLILRVLEEKSNGDKSRWQPWLHTLPKSFNTGLYLDRIERIQVERLAPEFLKHQDLQFEACYKAMQQLLDNDQLPKRVASYLKHIGDTDDDDWEASHTMESLIRWAFSVVFTRSWRTASGKEANLVPLGDMFNHDSENPNVAPKPSSEDGGSMQLILKEDTDAERALHISYGLSTHPGRFLVLFGFWDRSSPFMDANLTIPEEFKVDRSNVVTSTRNGAMTEDVWVLATYKFLLERDPEAADKLAEAQKIQDDDAIFEIISKWDLEVALYLRLHVLKLLSETYPDMVRGHLVIIYSFVLNLFLLCRNANDNSQILPFMAPGPCSRRYEWFPKTLWDDC